MRRPLLALLLIPLLALLAAPPAAAASFDCTRPGLTADEAAICRNRSLNDADVRMATTLHFLGGLFAMGRRGAMMDDQVRWLHQRRSCKANVACLRRAYDQRQRALQALYDSIDRPL